MNCGSGVFSVSSPRTFFPGRKSGKRRERERRQRENLSNCKDLCQFTLCKTLRSLSVLILSVHLFYGNHKIIFARQPFCLLYSIKSHFLCPTSPFSSPPNPLLFSARCRQAALTPRPSLPSQDISKIFNQFWSPTFLFTPVSISIHDSSPGIFQKCDLTGFLFYY